MIRALRRDAVLKSGRVIPAGTKVAIRPATVLDIHPRFLGQERFYAVASLEDGSTVKIHWDAVFPAPSMKTLSRMVMDGIAKSVRGQRVEPDGHDSEGFPAWPVALGVI